MVYTLDISAKSPAFVKWDNEGNLIDVLYLTYNLKSCNLKVWQNIHINKKNIENGVLVGDVISDKWHRLKYIWDRIEYFFEDIDVIVIEGAAFGGTGRVADLANTTGFYVGNILSRANPGVQVVEYSPTAIKLEFTGRGSSGKTNMRDTVKKQYTDIEEQLLKIEKEGGIMRYSTPLEDIVDAFAIGKNYFKLLKQEKSNGKKC